MGLLRTEKMKQLQICLLRTFSFTLSFNKLIMMTFPWVWNRPKTPLNLADYSSTFLTPVDHNPVVHEWVSYWKIVLVVGMNKANWFIRFIEYVFSNYLEKIEQSCLDDSAVNFFWCNYFQPRKKSSSLFTFASSNHLR